MQLKSVDVFTSGWSALKARPVPLHVPDETELEICSIQSQLKADNDCCDCKRGFSGMQNVTRTIGVSVHHAMHRLPEIPEGVQHCELCVKL